MDGVRKRRHGAHAGLGNRRRDLTEGSGHHPRDGRVGEGPAQAVIPKAGRRQPSTPGAQVRGLVIEEHPQQEVVVDDDIAVAQARSGSAAAILPASVA